MTRNSLVLELDTHNLAFQAFGLLRCKGIAANEILVELCKHAQAGLKRSNLVGQLVAIERQAYLEAQSIAATETARLHLAAAYQLVPYLVGECMGSVYLEAVLACVACTAYDYCLAVALYFLACIECEVAALDAQDALYHLFGLGALDCYLAVLLALVLDHNIEFLRLLHNPCNILVDVRCIDDKEVTLGSHLIYQQVIDNTACRMTHHSVEYLAVGSILYVVCEDVVYECLAFGTGDKHLAHVRNVEDTACLTHCVVLIDNVGVLYRHVKAAERAYERA